MIEFYGMLSKECLIKSFKRYNKKNALMVFIILFPVVLITNILLGVFKSKDFYYILILSIISLIANLALLFIPPKSFIFSLPRKITISQNMINAEITVLNGKWPKKVKPLSSVKKVIDEGEWYDIVFKYDNSWYWVIQKDLITKGTIEEFEKLFEGKIIRKNQN